MTTNAGWRVAAAGLLVFLAAACSSSSSTSAPAPTVAAALPPAQFADLARVFDPQVAPLGLRVTRGSLVDSRTRRYSTTGTHLALYVEPTAQWPNSKYVESIVPLTRTLAPALFARWPGLHSFDVCQEPSAGVDDRPEPAPVTTVDITREASAAIDWGTADLVTMATASARNTGLRLTVSPALGAEPAMSAALQQAGAEGGAGN